jgi:hypothetical protein
LKKKSEALFAFKTFKNELEKEIRNTIKIQIKQWRGIHQQ